MRRALPVRRGGQPAERAQRAAAAALLAACAAVAGCGALRIETQEPAPWVQAGEPRPGSDAESLLQYFQHLRGLSGSELGREHEAARQAYARERTEFNRVRLALLLALPNTPYSDKARALELLDPVARNRAGRLAALAALLAAQLEERRRLEASAQGLQHKLEALRALERRLIERSR